MFFVNLKTFLEVIRFLVMTVFLCHPVLVKEHNKEI